MIGFRQYVRDRFADRDVIVLAVDGIPHDLACRVWRRAQVTRARSVFPTTSSTAWLTSLTGASVDAHGIPGVVFEESGSLVDVYAYQGPLGDALPNVFGDAAARGFSPVAIAGDLPRCTWRELLLRGATVREDDFFARGDAPDAERVRIAVERVRTPRSFVWCFVDADRYIHRHGYDPPLIEFLERIDAIAAAWSRDAVVIAHSDHGLVPTHHDPDIAGALAGYRMGGAGRTRWLYVDDAPRVRAELARRLPASVRIRDADEMFAGAARRRVGSIVLVAEGEDFLAPDGYRFEHGSLTEAELDVPIAEWRC